MIYIDIHNYLAKRGQKVYSDSSLKSFTKEQLIEQIRYLEYNYSGEIWGSELLAKRLENACNYIKGLDVPLEKINKIISIEGENI